MGTLGTLRARLGLGGRSGRSDAAGPATETHRRRTFIDPALQQQFERDGFVVVDLIDAATVERLRTRYDELDHEHRESYDWVEGFDTSIYDGRPDYRAQVLDLIEEHLSPGLERVLDDHRIMFANFVVKQPRSAAVPPHVDWTFLDEDRFSSVTVWCPLVDTTTANGTLGLVTGSHRRIDFLRAANIPTFERCEQAVADIDDRPVVPLTAGQAIILDNRVVHFSPPNTTEAQRIAIGCVAGPVEADLHHFWMDEQEQLVRFEIDRSFYLSYVIGEPPAHAGGVRATTNVAAG